MAGTSVEVLGGCPDCKLVRIKKTGQNEIKITCYPRSMANQLLTVSGMANFTYEKEPVELCDHPTEFAKK